MFTIYVIRDEEGKATFVGRTRDFTRRSVEHAARGWVCEELGTFDDPWKSRVVQQYAIDQLKTGPGGLVPSTMTRPQIGSTK
jgi:hypothetical protein